MAIIKSQLHPKNDPIDIIYPETDISQVKGYVEPKVYNHYCILTDATSSHFIINFQIANNSNIKLRQSDIVNFNDINCIAKVYSLKNRTYEYYDYIVAIADDSITLKRYAFGSDDDIVEQTVTLNTSDYLLDDNII